MSSPFTFKSTKVPKNMQTIHKNISPTAQIPDGHFISMSLDYAGNVLLLMTTSEPDFRDGGFSKITPKNAQTYQIWSTVDNSKSEFYLYAEITASINFHKVQRFANGDILLVCARSQYRSNDKSDKNGYIYSADAKLKSQILLGDGIEDVQITKQGSIWTSYFDEGIFGNYGWSCENAIGTSGLVEFTDNGEKTFEFEPTSEVSPMYDCYSLNVTSNNLTYCYYYSDFDLVEIKNQTITDYWHMPIAGSHAFFIEENQAIFVGGYDSHYEQEAFYLLDLNDNHKVTVAKQIILASADSAENILQNGNRFSYVYTRGNQMLVIKGTNLYCLSFCDFL